MATETNSSATDTGMELLGGLLAPQLNQLDNAEERVETWQKLIAEQDAEGKGEKKEGFEGFLQTLMTLFKPILDFFKKMLGWVNDKVDNVMDPNGNVASKAAKERVGNATSQFTGVEQALGIPGLGAELSTIMQNEVNDFLKSDASKTDGADGERETKRAILELHNGLIEFFKNKISQKHQTMTEQNVIALATKAAYAVSGLDQIPGVQDEEILLNRLPAPKSGVGKLMTDIQHNRNRKRDDKISDNDIAAITIVTDGIKIDPPTPRTVQSEAAKWFEQAKAEKLGLVADLNKDGIADLKEVQTVLAKKKVTLEQIDSYEEFKQLLMPKGQANSQGRNQ